jgi:hypothetical protein
MGAVAMAVVRDEVRSRKSKGVHSLPALPQTRPYGYGKFHRYA